MGISMKFEFEIDDEKLKEAIIEKVSSAMCVFGKYVFKLGEIIYTHDYLEPKTEPCYLFMGLE